MKFQRGQKLYYVNPFVSTIEIVELDIYSNEDNQWIDKTYAFLNEEDLFDNIPDAQEHAFNLLVTYCVRRRQQIDEFDEEIENL